MKKYYHSYEKEFDLLDKFWKVGILLDGLNRSNRCIRIFPKEK